MWSLCYAFQSQSYSRVHIYTHRHRHQCNWNAFHIRSSVRRHTISKIRPCALLFPKKGRSESAAWWRTCTSYPMHKLHNHVCTFVIRIYIYITPFYPLTKIHAQLPMNTHICCFVWATFQMLSTPIQMRIESVIFDMAREWNREQTTYMKICSLCVNWVKIHAFF